MTAFLPASPRRKWHPSQWNIARVGSVVGTALALGGCNDDTVGSEQSDTTDYTDIQDGYVDSNWDYSEYTEYTDYDDRWDGYTDYTEYTDYQDGYQDWHDDDYWYPECYYDRDCPPNWECVNNYCEPGSECRTSAECEFDQFCDESGGCVEVTLPSQCLAPALQPIPLPDEAGGVIVALRFANLDDDPAQELVLLRNDAVVVIDGDVATTATHGAFALDGLAATDVDDDGVMDLVATSSTKLNTRVFQGDGLGGFVDTGTGPAMMLDQAHGIDWPTSGPGELLARTQADEAVILSSLVQQMPELEQLGFGMVEGLGVGDFDGDSGQDVVALQGCWPQFKYQGGASTGNDALGPPGPCSVSVGDVDGDPIDDVAILRADASFSVITLLAPPTEPPFAVVGLYGAYQAAHPIAFGLAWYGLIVQSGTELEFLYGDQQLGSWCRGPLDELPPVVRFAVGDFDGDGADEIATVDQNGAVALWSDG